MKKTIIALLALAGVTMAEDVALTLSSPASGSLTSSNTLVKWQTSVDGVYTDITELTSWALTFTLDIERKSNGVPIIAANDLAFIQNNGSNNNCSVKFAMNGDGTLKFYGYTTGGNSGISTNSTDVFLSTQTITNDDGSTTTIIPDTAITLQFIANEDADGNITGGTLSALSGDKALSIELDSALTLTNSSSIRLWTNLGNEQFKDISLTSLSNNVIPEPTTATLSLLALAGLAARRRRK